MRIILVVTGTLAFFFMSCFQTPTKKLPIIGNHEIVGNDTIYHQISNFEFINQDSIYINNRTLSNNIYLADFFYTYCPSVCPKVKSQMLRIHDKFQNNESVKLISFALDPKRDNVPNLKLYSENLEISNDKWHFLSGNKDEIWELAEEFLVSVREDPEEPGGIFHSGKILLIDTNGYIRAFANGTIENEVDKLMTSIEILLKENENSL